MQKFALLAQRILLSAIVLASLAIPFVTSALAQDAQVILVCTPTVEAMDKCQAAGGTFDSARCRCIRPKPASTSIKGPCALVCIDGRLDAVRCRCVKD
jgi:hypothetical protein